MAFTLTPINPALYEAVRAYYRHCVQDFVNEGCDLNSTEFLADFPHIFIPNEEAEQGFDDMPVPTNPREQHHKVCPDCNRQRMGGTPAHVATGSQDVASDYLEKGYFSKPGVLREELVTSTADKLAAAFAARKLTTGQLRRFYSHVKAAENRLRMTGDWPAVSVDVKKLGAFAAEAKGKQKVPDNFYAFIDANVRAVNAKDDFFAFIQHFESVVAFFSYHNPRG